MVIGDIKSKNERENRAQFLLNHLPQHKMNTSLKGSNLSKNKFQALNQMSKINKENKNKYILLIKHNMEIKNKIKIHSVAQTWWFHAMNLVNFGCQVESQVHLSPMLRTQVRQKYLEKPVHLREIQFGSRMLMNPLCENTF
jgi:hypothetical protein